MRLLSFFPKLNQAFLTIVEVILVCFFGALLAHIVSPRRGCNFFLAKEEDRERERNRQREAWRREKKRHTPNSHLVSAPLILSSLWAFSLAPTTPRASKFQASSNKTRKENEKGVKS